MISIFICILVLALIFDFINGFHDAANSISMIVSTKVLSPIQAVIWAASFNMLAFFVAKYIIGEFGIANTVAKTVYAEYATLPVIFSGLIAAIAWNLLTWWVGIPSSSSHTLIGGFAGAAIAAHGFDAVRLGVVAKIASFIVLSPLIGMLLAMGLSILLLHVCKRADPNKANRWFRRVQLISSALFSLGHGLNDSQKVIGIIAAAMISIGHISSIDAIPTWVPLSCFTVIGLGTLSGGWRIVKTMGGRITKITSLEGVVADTAGAFTLFITEILRVPVSTTHTIAGAIVGAGASKRVSAVRWGVTLNLLWAWVLTIPVSALIAAGVYLLLNSVIGG